MEQEGASAEGKLRRLVDLVVAEDEGPELEAGIRSWSQQNAKVGAAQQRVDRTQIDYLRGLWREISGDDGEAEDMAVLLAVPARGRGRTRPAAGTPGPGGAALRADLRRR